MTTMKKVNIPNLKQKLEHIGMKTTLFDDMEHDNYKNLVCQSAYEIETKNPVSYQEKIEKTLIEEGFTITKDGFAGIDTNHSDVYHTVFIENTGTGFFVTTEINFI